MSNGSSALHGAWGTHRLWAMGGDYVDTSSKQRGHRRRPEETYFGTIHAALIPDSLKSKVPLLEQTANVRLWSSGTRERGRSGLRRIAAEQDKFSGREEALSQKEIQLLSDNAALKRQLQDVRRATTRSGWFSQSDMDALVEEHRVGMEMKQKALDNIRAELDELKANTTDVTDLREMNEDLLARITRLESFNHELKSELQKSNETVMKYKIRRGQYNALLYSFLAMGGEKISLTEELRSKSSQLDVALAQILEAKSNLALDANVLELTGERAFLEQAEKALIVSSMKQFFEFNFNELGRLFGMAKMTAEDLQNLLQSLAEENGKTIQYIKKFSPDLAAAMSDFVGVLVRIRAPFGRVIRADELIEQARKEGARAGGGNVRSFAREDEKFDSPKTFGADGRARSVRSSQLNSILGDGFAESDMVFMLEDGAGERTLVVQALKVKNTVNSENDHTVHSVILAFDKSFMWFKATNLTEKMIQGKAPNKWKHVTAMDDVKSIHWGTQSNVWQWYIQWLSMTNTKAFDNSLVNQDIVLWKCITIIFHSGLEYNVVLSDKTSVSLFMLAFVDETSPFNGAFDCVVNSTPRNPANIAQLRALITFMELETKALESDYSDVGRYVFTALRNGIMADRQMRERFLMWKVMRLMFPDRYGQPPTSEIIRKVLTEREEAQTQRRRKKSETGKAQLNQAADVVEAYQAQVEMEREKRFEVKAVKPSDIKKLGMWR